VWQRPQEFQENWAAPPELIKLLQIQFALEFEGVATARYRNRVFTRWHSTFPEDRAFGAMEAISSSNFQGKNIFMDGSRAELQTEEEEKSALILMINQLKLSMKSEAPTRAILIIPDQGKSTSIELAKRKGFLEIATVNANSTLFRRRVHSTTEPRIFPRKFSIFLFSNQISWFYDPVTWIDYLKAIESWGRTYAQGQVQIPTETVRKFQEVKMPDRKARLPAKLAETRQHPGPIVLVDGLPYHRI